MKTHQPLLMALLAMLLGFTLPTQAQSDSVEIDEEIFVVVEQDPTFPGGYDGLAKFLSENIKYPELAKANGITGKVFVQFTVEKDGSVSNIKLIRDIGGGCGQEVIRVVQLMPKWNPGMQKGKPVRTSFTLPVAFDLVADEVEEEHGFFYRLFHRKG